MNIVNTKQYKYLIICLLKYAIIIFFLIVQNFINFSESINGIVILSISIISLIMLIKDNILLSPFSLCEMLLISFGLYELHLVSTMTHMDITTKIVIIISLLAWNIICVLNRSIFKFRNKHVKLDWKKGDYSLGIFIICSFIVCSLLNLSEWVYAGGIPLFRSDMETFRFNVVYNSIIHVIAMCIKYIPFFVIVYCKFDLKFLIKKHFIILLCMVGSVIILLCTGFRGELMISLVFIALLYYEYNKPNLITLIKLGLLFSTIMAIYPIIRSYGLYGLRYIKDIKSISTYSELWFLTPLYQTFANAFHIFNKDISIFPEVLDFGLGKYTILANIPFLDVESLADAQNRVWNNGFFAELTATVFGPFYADFGYLGCIIGLSIIALLCNYFYNNYLNKHSLKHFVLYVLIFYKGFQMLYDYTFDFVAFLYFVYLWMVFTFKIKR